MNEDIIKRLQDMLKVLSAVLTQLEEVGWLIKDIVEDLVLDLSQDKTLIEKKEGNSFLSSDPLLNDTKKGSGEPD